MASFQKTKLDKIHPKFRSAQTPMGWACKKPKAYKTKLGLIIHIHSSLSPFVQARKLQASSVHLLQLSDSDQRTHWQLNNTQGRSSHSTSIPLSWWYLICWSSVRRVRKFWGASFTLSFMLVLGRRPLLLSPSNRTACNRQLWEKDSTTDAQSPILFPLHYFLNLIFTVVFLSKHTAPLIL